MWYNSLLEKNLLPDFAIRLGIKYLLHQRLREEYFTNTEQWQAHHSQLIEELKKSPIAVHTTHANEQHYEVPTLFFKYVLGKHLKYSCGYWPRANMSLDESEAEMLALTCERAELQNGQHILELGCGWGSLSLYMADRYPLSAITCVSNSRTQKKYIDEQAAIRGLDNLTVVTADMNEFDTEKKFDRVVSVEMFEHMRNYTLLLQKIAGFMHPEGKLFIHMFTHKQYTYLFEAKNTSDWMAKYFFSGGTMPSDYLLLYFPEHFHIQKHWRVNGTHYAKTSEAWLQNMYKHKPEIMGILAATYGNDNVKKWWVYWRVFFMACAELWGFRHGNEWFVSHYLCKVNK